MSSRESSCTGLSSAEAAARLERCGPNVIAVESGVRWPRILARQFTSLLIVILIAAAVIAFVVGERIDAAAILAIVVLNGLLGFFQEWRAERALEALRSLLSETAVVVRDGEERQIDARELVPGDLVLLGAGDRIPADIELARATDLSVDESVLTGESAPVEKRERGETDADDRTRRVFMGTAAVDGRGEGVVTATGMDTEFGGIAGLTASVGEKETHLQQRLGVLGRYLGVGALLVAGLIAGAGIALGKPAFDMLLTGVSLAVAAVPEGLPAVVTITLALGAGAMVKRKALSRRLQAAETLGAASAICTDKTGTLTENRMTAVRVWLAAGVIDVTGTGDDPAGQFEVHGERIDDRGHGDLQALLLTALVCNHASLRRGDAGWQATGEPTEAALVVLAHKGRQCERDGIEVRRELPFSSERKRMTMIGEQDGALTAYVKGAPEIILERSSECLKDGKEVPLDAELRETVETAYRDMAGDGLRVLALARRGLEDADAPAEEIENDLVLLGLVGMIDPPRPEVEEAVRRAREAGIDVLMITGDAPLTARAIAGQLGLAAEQVVAGDEIDTLSDAELEKAVEGGAVFARSSPGHKMRIIELLQARGQVVAMTGDGVNDAPALKRADIGIAMGLRGTDVAKDAADMVLLDDNFASIVNAVEEGRRQYENIRKFVRYLLASNVGEVLALFANILAGGPLIFLPIQILWMNLVTDSVTALTLALEKTDERTMRQPPRPADAGIVGRGGLAVIVMFGLYTSGATLYVFYDALGQGTVFAQTAAFTAMIVFEKASVFAFRSFRTPTHRIGYFSNPWLLAAVAAMLGLHAAAVYWPPLQVVLHTEGLAGDTWLTIALLALPLLFVPEAVKLISARGPGPGLEAAEATR